MKRVCVFCGSNPGADSHYRAAAGRLGAVLARDSIGLVFGGGSVGLMGTLADATLAEGGEVIGVIPQGLVDKELAHTGATDLRVVASMHERKALMADLADGFIALPGGMGTLDELCEMLAWAQLGIHQKPCGLLNVDGYFRQLLAFFDYAVAEQFIRPEHRAMIVVEEDPERLLHGFQNYQAPSTDWLDRLRT